MSGIQCAECGRFLGEADFAAGHVYYEPESEFGHERIEWACRRHGIPTRAVASCDTHPKDGDVEQAPLVSGAVVSEASETHNTDSQSNPLLGE